MAKRDPRLRAFVKIDKLGQVVPSSLILRRKPPQNGVSHVWEEIEANVCCSEPLSNFSYSSNSTGTGVFTISVGGSIVVNAPNTEAGTLAIGAGQVVVATVTGTGPQQTLLVIDDTTGVVLSNQVGTTGPTTFTFTGTGDIYSIIATQNLTTTTTTTTSTTSTTTTSTTSTSTTTTSTTSTTTTSTTFAAGSLRVVNNVSSPTGVTITQVLPSTNFTGGTFPVAESSGTTMTVAVAGVNQDITFTIAATGVTGTRSASLYQNGALIETLAPITAVGSYSFGPISFLTTDRLEIILS